MTIWHTPIRIFAPLDEVFHFTQDLCADYDNAKVKDFIETSKSLTSSWQGEGPAFINPPYVMEIKYFTEKAYKESERGRLIVGVLPGRTNPPWWHNHVMRAAEIHFVQKKQAFDGSDGKGVPPWGVVVVVWYPTAAKGWITREERYQAKKFPIVYSWDIKCPLYSSFENGLSSVVPTPMAVRPAGH